MSDIEFSKYKKREISSFVGQELLYDYISNNLDQDRKEVVAKYLKYSRDAQLDLQKIELGLQYTQQLSGMSVSNDVMSEVKKPNTYLYLLLQKSHYERWPVGMKWGVESLIVVGVLVILLSVAPWEKILQLGSGSPGAKVVLAEAKKVAPEKADIDAKAPETDSSKEVPQFVDEGLIAAVKSGSVDENKVVDIESPTAKTPSKNLVANNMDKAPAVKEVPEAKKQTLPKGVPAVLSGGYLYRGTLTMKGLATSGGKIKDKVVDLGGRKAGDVDLGWQKNANSQYYHFTLPQAKYEELMNYLAPFGKLTISREKHPRIMPDGIIRLIVTVEEDNN